MNRGARSLACVAAVIAGVACASSIAPPGGPPDLVPPHLLRVTPDSGQVRAQPKEVTFAFDEVISEVPHGAADLAHLVLISPSDGLPVVHWERTRLTVRPRKGWRADVTYAITLLPGITDLHNNARDTATVVVFSTGATIPNTRVNGVVFDWLHNVFAPRAYIEARAVKDTTQAYATEADSLGHFSLAYLPPDEYIVRALIDANHNRGIDPRESWDTVRVALRDSAAIDFYALPHDSAGPRLSGPPQIADSLTIRLTFDKALLADTTYLPTIEIHAVDSSIVPIARISPWPSLVARRDARKRQVADSAAAADTSATRRAARDKARTDSINRAAVITDSLARDTTHVVPKPKSARPALVTEIAVELLRPLPPSTVFQIFATAVGVFHVEQKSQRGLVTPKPAAAPPGGKRDSGDVRLPARSPPR